MVRNCNKVTEIKNIRTQLGMSQSKFCEYFHINIFTLQMWEQQINNTSPTVLYLVKRILELEGRPYVPQDTEKVAEAESEAEVPAESK